MHGSLLPLLPVETARNDVSVQSNEEVTVRFEVFLIRVARQAHHRDEAAGEAQTRYYGDENMTTNLYLILIYGVDFMLIYRSSMAL